MKLQTHLKLYLREIIDNWKYIDSIIFLFILLMYVGFTDPCDRCIVRNGGNDLTCKEAFLKKLGYEEENGVIKKNYINMSEIDFSNITYYSPNP